METVNSPNILTRSQSVTMFVHLLIFVCASAGLGMADELPPSSPPYREYLEELEKAEAFLDKNILSMATKIPLLDDPRRQYAEIFHYANQAALAQTDCVIPPYNYQEYLNKSSPEALSKPQLVIDEVNELLERFKQSTSKIQGLVRNCVGTDCNAVVDALVKRYPEKYAKESEIYLAGGAAAAALDGDSKLFEKVAKNLDAHKFLIRGSVMELQDVVSKLANLHRKLDRYYQANC